MVEIILSGKSGRVVECRCISPTIGILDVYKRQDLYHNCCIAIVVDRYLVLIGYLVLGLVSPKCMNEAQKAPYGNQD